MLILYGWKFQAFSQQAAIQIPFTSEVIGAYVDRPGDLYILLDTRRLIKYSKEGKLLHEFKLTDIPTVFEPRDGSRTFAYYRTRNLAGFIHFGMEPTTRLNEEYAVEPMLVCSAGDQGIWILDRADYSLKRVNLARSKVDVEFPLPMDIHGNIVSMREYQGYLFLLYGQTRILIFSGMGKLLRSITGHDIRFFNFIGEELYYTDNGVLHFYDLFDSTQRQEPAEAGSRFVLLTDEARFAVYPDKAMIFRAR